MAYPNTTNNLTGVTDKQPGVQQGTEWKSATVNPWVSEINAITVELGALPKAGYADVKARLDASEAAAGGMPIATSNGHLIVARLGDKCWWQL